MAALTPSAQPSQGRIFWTDPGHVAALTPPAQPSQGRIFWTEWQKGFMGQSLLLPEGNNTSQGPPPGGPGPPPLCLLELMAQDFLASYLPGSTIRR